MTPHDIAIEKISGKFRQQIFGPFSAKGEGGGWCLAIFREGFFYFLEIFGDLLQIFGDFCLFLSIFVVCCRFSLMFVDTDRYTVVVRDKHHLL
jgi:hypothetical protein